MKNQKKRKNREKNQESEKLKNGTNIQKLKKKLITN